MLDRSRDDRIAELEEEVHQLRALLKPEVGFPDAWGLTRKQTEVLAVLFASYPKYASTHRFSALIWSYEDRSLHLLNVFIYQIRKKLRPHGVIVLNHSGHGWKIDDASWPIVKQAVRR